MTRAFADDEAIAQLTQALIDRTLPKAQWTHAAHFAVALWIVAQRPDLDAARDLPGIIRGYDASIGGENNETASYHETITQASLQAARGCLRAYRGRPIHEIVDLALASPLGDPDWPLEYWSREVLYGVEARRRWVPPDLKPLGEMDVLDDVEELPADRLPAELPGLAETLAAAVASGASIGFVTPFNTSAAAEFWRGVMSSIRAGARRLLVVREGGRVVGTVMLVLDALPNGRHRAELAKLMVHPEYRGRGIAERLIRRAEKIAIAEGRTLLVLDTCTGEAAERLYLRLGWHAVGSIPGFAAWPDGRLGATTVMYRQLAG